MHPAGNSVAPPKQSGVSRNIEVTRTDEEVSSCIMMYVCIIKDDAFLCRGAGFNTFLSLDILPFAYPIVTRPFDDYVSRNTARVTLLPKT